MTLNDVVGKDSQAFPSMTFRNDIVAVFFISYQNIASTTRQHGDDLLGGSAFLSVVICILLSILFKQTNTRTHLKILNFQLLKLCILYIIFFLSI